MRPWQRTAQFLFAFACVFLGLALPARGLGPAYTRAHTSLGNWLVADEPTATGVRLHFSATNAELVDAPWRTTLHAEGPGGLRASFPIDLRSLTFLPLAAFVALAAAAPLANPRRNLLIASIGLALLVPLQLLLTALPVLALLGGESSFVAVRLGPATRVAIDIAYRALVAPPGMTYALPLFLFWVLLNTCGRESRLLPSR